jgi:prevent-host-death family protein
MRQVNIFEAKTNLSKLVEAVEAGETIIIARHGKPVAALTSLERVKRSWPEAVVAWQGVPEFVLERDQPPMPTRDPFEP